MARETCYRKQNSIKIVLWRKKATSNCEEMTIRCSTLRQVQVRLIVHYSDRCVVCKVRLLCSDIIGQGMFQ